MNKYHAMPKQQLHSLFRSAFLYMLGSAAFLIPVVWQFVLHSESKQPAWFWICAFASFVLMMKAVIVLPDPFRED